MQRRPTKIEHLDKLKCLCDNQNGSVLWKYRRAWRFFVWPIRVIDIICLSCGASELLKPCKKLAIELRHKFNKETK